MNKRLIIIMLMICSFFTGINIVWAESNSETSINETASIEQNTKDGTETTNTGTIASSSEDSTGQDENDIREGDTETVEQDAGQEENSEPVKEEGNLDEETGTGEQDDSIDEEGEESFEPAEDDGNPSDEESIGQATEISQDQNNEQVVTQDQKADDEDAKQSQEANLDTCGEQLLNQSGACGEKNDDLGLEQSQTIELETDQSQEAGSTEKTEANQDQIVDIDTDQTQEVHVSEGEENVQNQNTEIDIVQDQDASVTDGEIEQDLSADVTHTQTQEIGTTTDTQEQETMIEVELNQEISSVGSAQMEQNQEVAVSGEMDSSFKEKIKKSVKVSTENFIEFIKETMTVNIRHKITVNDEVMEEMESYTVLVTDDEIVSPDYKEQGQWGKSIEKQYEWGNLTVDNSGSFTYNESSQQFTSSMNSFINLNFRLEDSYERNLEYPWDDEDWYPDPEEPKPGGENPEEPTPGEEEPTPEEPVEEEPKDDSSSSKKKGGKSSVKTKIEVKFHPELKLLKDPFNQTSMGLFILIKCMFDYES